MKSFLTKQIPLEKKKFIYVSFIFIFLFFTLGIHSDDLQQNCNKCHAMNNFSYLNEDLKSLKNLTVNTEEFKNSAHGKLNCIDCHKETKSYPHNTDLPKVGCNSDCHSIDKEGKTYTHSKQENEFNDSIHTKGKIKSNPDSPTCINCHGYTNVHNIKKVTKTITQGEKISQCIVCHDNKEMMIRNKVEADAVESYRQSFHYKAVKFGGISSATCQDCHAVHKILPKDNQEASIHPNKVSDTCGQSGCHEGVKLNFAMSGANHLKLRVEKEPILYWEEKMFQILTGGTMAMLVVGIILDIQKKFGWFSVFEKLGAFIKEGFLLFITVLKKVLKLLKAL
ncbi:MAG TPA: hypothetical protein PKL30_13115, partial [Leptospiraceae bacterium]|nr:hypothetical protein [Leptospiraceae bacterium]